MDWAIALLSLAGAAVLTNLSPDKKGLSLLSLAGVWLVCHIIAFEATQIYRSIWRYPNSMLILKGIGCIVAAAVPLLVITPLIGFGAKLCLVALTIDITLWCLSRIGYAALHQYIYAYIGEKGKTPGTLPAHDKKNGKRLMIIGGGNAAEMLLSDFERTSGGGGYDPVCIVDDAMDKVGRSLRGVPIKGTTKDIAGLCRSENIEIVIFAIYNVDEEKKAAILEECAELNIPVKILPHYADYMNNPGKNLTMLRDVSVEDLLGRKKAVIDLPMLKEFISGKTVLVTGGGGSIGGELCRQIAAYSPKLLVIADVYENGAYEVQMGLRRKGFTNLAVEVLSVTDRVQMDALFARYRPDIVYHAAAHKHVPLMEDCPIEAVKNNIFGTYVTVGMSAKYGVKKFIMVSTDKAVNPTNVMGATKRACELIVKSANERCDTDFAAVRFGNVLGSNGSVIPLFREQLKSGGPLTVTHPECIRYFMTIPEAVELLLAAGSMAKGGETFVLDMGEPVKIADLARKMISLSGFVPDRDIKIEYIGMRPGEKMYEELLVNKLEVTKTCSEKVFVDKPEKIDAEWLGEKLGELRDFAEAQDTENLMRTLAELVPTYKKAER